MRTVHSKKNTVTASALLLTFRTVSPDVIHLDLYFIVSDTKVQFSSAYEEALWVGRLLRHVKLCLKMCLWRSVLSSTCSCCFSCCDFSHNTNTFYPASFVSVCYTGVVGVYDLFNSYAQWNARSRHFDCKTKQLLRTDCMSAFLGYMMSMTLLCWTRASDSQANFECVGGCVLQASALVINLAICESEGGYYVLSVLPTAIKLYRVICSHCATQL